MGVSALKKWGGGGGGGLLDHRNQGCDVGYGLSISYCTRSTECKLINRKFAKVPD